MSNKKLNDTRYFFIARATTLLIYLFIIACFTEIAMLARHEDNVPGIVTRTFTALETVYLQFLKSRRFFFEYS